MLNQKVLGVTSGWNPKPHLEVKAARGTGPPREGCKEPQSIHSWTYRSWRDTPVTARTWQRHTCDCEPGSETWPASWHGRIPKWPNVIWFEPRKHRGSSSYLCIFSGNTKHKNIPTKHNVQITSQNENEDTSHNHSNNNNNSSNNTNFIIKYKLITWNFWWSTHFYRKKCKLQKKYMKTRIS